MKWAGYELESELRTAGQVIIAGADEVGRGAIAGPLVVGVVILPDGCKLQLADSKLVSRVQRDKLAMQILDFADDFGLGLASAGEIDSLGLSDALWLALMRALEALDGMISEIIIDGRQNLLSDFEFGIARVKADRDVACVAAASIIAKVYRDELMCGVSSQFADYGFDSHVGYGTCRHVDALRSLGPTSLHRKSFEVKL